MKIIEIKVLIEAIADYRKEGKQLMIRLGKRYGLDISIESEYIEMITRGSKLVPRKGTISDRLNYHFHGGDCSFYNKKHQQHVTVALSNHPEFGHLDAWFLFKYLKSTKKYKDKIFDTNWLDLKPLLEKLYESGEVENIKKW